MVAESKNDDNRDLPFVTPVVVGAGSMDDDDVDDKDPPFVTPATVIAGRTDDDDGDLPFVTPVVVAGKDDDDGDQPFGTPAVVVVAAVDLFLGVVCRRISGRIFDPVAERGLVVGGF